LKQFLYQRQWSWRASGIALAFIFLLATVLVKPIGVSTQFVIFDGVVWNMVSSDLVVADSEAKHGYASSNAYLNKSGGKYAKSVATPLNYGFLFVIFMAVGGFVASRLRSARGEPQESEEPLALLQPSMRRSLLAFAGGFLVLVGARLAGGCTSGHMMSGMMQTSVSGYLFALGAFAAAIPTAILVYRTRR
jgi:uncharacterized membrane protein YedE/YeeE